MSTPSTPIRIQLRRQKGFNLQVDSLKANGLTAAKVDRTTPWGNSFRWAEHGLRWAYEQHRRWLYRPRQASLRARIRDELAGKNLACWCDHAYCHALTLLEVANHPDYPCHDMAPKHWCDHTGPEAFMGHTCLNSFPSIYLNLATANCTGEGLSLTGPQARLLYGRLCRLRLLEQYLHSGEHQQAAALAAEET